MAPAQAYFSKMPAKICSLRVDTLAIMLSLANVGAHAQVRRRALKLSSLAFFARHCRCHAVAWRTARPLRGFRHPVALTVKRNPYFLGHMPDARTLD